MTKQQPAYLTLYGDGKLQERIDQLYSYLKNCELCPRRCHVNRLNGEIGYCQAGADIMVSSAFPHYGEEAPLVGSRGSGTIFLSHCNLRCIFCQNYEISHLGSGEPITIEHLAKLMLFLQDKGCHNINFVTPTHFIPQIIAALPIAINLDLNLPLVYNCGGYESLEVVRLLDGIIDIYMPDAKFVDEAYAVEYMNAPDYFNNLQHVLREMYRQVGDLKIDERGIAYRGMIIRHLILPQGIAGTEKMMQFIADELSKNAYMNVMSQYHPCFEAVYDKILNRSITSSEFHQAIHLAKKVGLHRGF